MAIVVFQLGVQLTARPAISCRMGKDSNATDVLITHRPPLGILDWTGTGHVGDADLLERLSVVRPRVHAFGHIHESAGILVEDRTTYVIASICDGEYRPINPVRVVDL